MKNHPDTNRTDELDVFARIIHLGLMLFGILAFFTNGWAEDYAQIKHLALPCIAGWGWDWPCLFACD